ncbi:MAG TPA: hypothetical protein RMH85_29380 [Polyangiaceae bacterium LLY-WYZ-15_(1-7)]|nr:hypothetical protein [Sandaracinus sp.]HJL06821.1 hypothetical protein [Polyangiaceae bacterium LLY-WYZ-15_(1-7)]MBJ74463.1 hypothetical protein [Sandaracinus sp.]HJL12629.1 hypothetical protein [Polyangiaceae bacterium LLY-WYZ-15_(1-7)]HJL21651.1 hypothetical protein [Polyangiaceae bacterium LLY-WYZ-15_(1-7)]
MPAEREGASAAPMRAGRGILVVALVLLVAGGGVLWWSERRSDAPLTALDAFVRELALGEDEAAYARMSARYRGEADLEAFRYAVAGLSELRSANGVWAHVRAGERWKGPESPWRRCVDLTGVQGGAPRMAVVLVEEEGGWRVDALGLGERQLDEAERAPTSLCRRP